MARTGENIRLRKDGRWEGRFSKGRVNGKTIQGSVFGHSYQEVRLKLTQAKAEYAAVSRLPYEGWSGDSSMLFGVIAEEWFACAIPTLKPSSISSYRNILDRHLLPAFGGKMISCITKAEVSSFMNLLLTSGKGQAGGLSPKTVSCVMSVMKLVFDYADDVKGISVCNLRRINVRQKQRQIRVFSLAEQQALTDLLFQDFSPVNLGILLCLYTGLRAGEVCALRWRNISSKERLLRVEHTLQRIQLLRAPQDSQKDNSPRTRVILVTPKSSSSVRDIPIPGTLLEVLDKMRRPDDCFILTGKKNRFMEPRALAYRYSALLAKCGITNATLHTCRHTFATRCVELGFDSKTLSEILGHASVTITMNRYVHPSLEMKRKSMDMLCDMIQV